MSKIDRKWAALIVVAIVVLAGISVMFLVKKSGDNDIITTDAETIRVHLEDLPTGFGLMEVTNSTTWPSFYRSVAMWEFFHTGVVIANGINFVGVCDNATMAKNITANLRAQISTLGDLTDLEMGDESFQCHPDAHVAYYVVREKNVVFYITVFVTDATIDESTWVQTLLNNINDRV